MPLIAYSKRLSTEFRVIENDGPLKTVRALIAAPAPGGVNWAVRSQTHLTDGQGGSTARDPFRNRVRLRDMWNEYADYTLTKEDAIERLLAFESLYPEVSNDWVKDRRIPHVAAAIDGPWSRLRR